MEERALSNQWSSTELVNRMASPGQTVDETETYGRIGNRWRLKLRPKGSDWSSDIDSSTSLDLRSQLLFYLIDRRSE